MSETEHTPGPWNYFAGSHSVWGDGERRAICVMSGPRKNVNDGQRAANATLIAAAPDMLAALKLVELWLVNCVPTVDLPGPKPLPVLRAAIAKAEGR